MNSNTVSFDPDLFVNREKAIKLFLNMLHAGTQKRHLEFNGVAGQGKTELLKWIYYNPYKEHYFPAYVDFELAKYHRPENYPILETIANQLSARISPTSFHSFKKNLSPFKEEFQKVYRDTWTSARSLDQKPPRISEDILTKTFNKDLSSLLDSCKIVFCLDSTEKAFHEGFHALEEQVLKHHTTHENFFLVTAGQTELVWKNTEMKRQVKRHELPDLDLRSIGEQVESLATKKGFEIEDREWIPKKLHQLTLGHPFSNYKLIDFWTDGFKGQLTKAVVEDQQRFAQSIQNLIRDVIQERILDRVELDEVYPSAIKILWYLCPLRRIELSTLSYMLSTFLEDWFRDKPFIFFERLMKEFQNTYIFTRWRLGSGYDLKPVVRNIFLYDMQINALSKFLEIQETLAKYYDSRVEQTRDATQISNIVESLYHYAIYLRGAQPNYNIDALIQDEVQRYLSTYLTLEFTGSEIVLRDQLNRLSNTLEYDAEFANILNIDALLQIITRRMENELEKNTR